VLRRFFRSRKFKKEILSKDRGKGAGSSRQYSLIQNLIFLQIEDGIGKECDLGGELISLM
jgi:hypothetical protein